MRSSPGSAAELDVANQVERCWPAACTTAWRQNTFQGILGIPDCTLCSTRISGQPSAIPLCQPGAPPRLGCQGCCLTTKSESPKINTSWPFSVRCVLTWGAEERCPWVALGQTDVSLVSKPWNSYANPPPQVL